MNQLKKHYRTILGIGLPLLAIVLIVLSVQFPALFTPPQYDFIFILDDIEDTSYRMGRNFFNGERSSTFGYGSGHNPPVYLYDVSEDSAEEISLEQARELRYYEQKSPSPDGYTVIALNKGTRKQALYLSKQSSRVKLDIQLDPNAQAIDFTILGWIKEQK